MATETDLVNVALQAHIGHEPITSIDQQGNTVAETCKRIYPIARDDALRQVYWNFATARQQLASVTYDVDGEWGHAYQLPADFLRVRRFAGDGSLNARRFHGVSVPYRIEGRILITNATTPLLVYTRRVEDVNQFDATFFNALAVYLASFLAVSIRKDRDLQKQLLSLWSAMRDDAAGIDESEGGHDSYVSSDLLINR